MTGPLVLMSRVYGGRAPGGNVFLSGEAVVSVAVTYCGSNDSLSSPLKSMGM